MPCTVLWTAGARPRVFSEIVEIEEGRRVSVQALAGRIAKTEHQILISAPSRHQSRPETQSFKSTSSSLRPTATEAAGARGACSHAGAAMRTYVRACACVCAAHSPLAG